MGPMESARVGDPEVPTINARKHHRQAPWRVLMEIQERPPSTLKNVDGGPPGLRGGSGPHPGSERSAVTCIGMIDKK
jgi:hypothetical protein